MYPLLELGRKLYRDQHALYEAEAARHGTWDYVTEISGEEMANLVGGGDHNRMKRLSNSSKVKDINKREQHYNGYDYFMIDNKIIIILLSSVHLICESSGIVVRNLSFLFQRNKHFL